MIQAGMQGFPSNFPPATAPDLQIPVKGSLSESHLSSLKTVENNVHQNINIHVNQNKKFIYFNLSSYVSVF